MTFDLSPAKDEDFLELMGVLWQAFETPLKRYAAGELEEAKANPEIHWVKVVDSETGRIVGGSKWIFHGTDPFSEPPEKPFEATWFPPGPKRELATQLVLGMHEPRAQRARRPHAFMNIAFVLPEYRRRGIAKLCLEWGVRKAGELGVESWLDSSNLGRDLYPQFGFVYVTEKSVEPKEPEGLSAAGKAEWDELHELVGPLHFKTMWRPVGGKYVEGVTVKPWEESA